MSAADLDLVDLAWIVAVILVLVAIVKTED